MLPTELLEILRERMEERKALDKAGNRESAKNRPKQRFAEIDFQFWVTRDFDNSFDVLLKVRHAKSNEDWTAYAHEYPKAVAASREMDNDKSFGWSLRCCVEALQWDTEDWLEDMEDRRRAQFGDHMLRRDLRAEVQAARQELEAQVRRGRGGRRRNKSQQNRGEARQQRK